jgi:hypothetical protein
MKRKISMDIDEDMANRIVMEYHRNERHITDKRFMKINPVYCKLVLEAYKEVEAKFPDMDNMQKELAKANSIAREALDTNGALTVPEVMELQVVQHMVKDAQDQMENVRIQDQELQKRHMVIRVKYANLMLEVNGLKDFYCEASETQMILVKKVIKNRYYPNGQMRMIV